MIINIQSGGCLTVLHPNTSPDIIELKNEQALNNIIESGHRTIDWSVSLYFKTLKRSNEHFLDKIFSCSNIDFCQSFYKYYINETELGQLIKEIETHVNNEIITVQNKWFTQVKFNIKTNPLELNFINQLFNEQKNTLKLSQHVNQNICRLTSQNLTKLAPSFMPKPLVAKTNCTLSERFSKVMGVDTDGHCSYSKEALEKLLNMVLENIERELKQQLKFQLADQLYQWYDRFAVDSSEADKQLISQ